MKFYNNKNEMKTIPFIIIIFLMIILFSVTIYGLIKLFPNKIPQPELVYNGYIKTLEYQNKEVQAVNEDKDFVMNGNVIAYFQDQNNYIKIITTRNYWFSNITSIENIKPGYYYIYYIDYEYKPYYNYVISPIEIINWNNIKWQKFDH